MCTFTFTWKYTFISGLIYDCSLWTLTSINNTNKRADYRIISIVTCSVTIRVCSTFFSNLSFDGASCNWSSCYYYKLLISFAHTQHIILQGFILLGYQPVMVFSSECLFIFMMKLNCLCSCVFIIIIRSNTKIWDDYKDMTALIKFNSYEEVVEAHMAQVLAPMRSTCIIYSYQEFILGVVMLKARS